MIEHIQIRNFKSLRDVSVSLSPVTVLIGRSGAGKSNFLRAIRFLRNALVGRDAVAQEGGWPRIYPFAVKGNLAFDVKFRIPGYDDSFEYSIAWIPGDETFGQMTLVDYEKLSLGKRVLFSRLANDWEKWPGPGKPPPAVSAGPLLKSFPTITEAVLASTAWTSGIGWHDFPAGVFAESEQDNRALNDDRGLADGAENYIRVVREITQDLRDQVRRRHILSRIKQINPSVTAVELDNVVAPTKVIVTHSVGDQQVPLDLSQESDGFRRYYAHLLALYQTPPKQLLMFEEPENGIYPGALRNLAEEFKSAAKHGRGQVLLATQSPDLLDGFEPEALRVVDVDDEQTTRIRPLDAGQVDAIKEQLLDPGELLTVTSPQGAVAAHT